jgi:hypothetical protein
MTGIIFQTKMINRKTEKETNLMAVDGEERNIVGIKQQFGILWRGR